MKKRLTLLMILMSLLNVYSYADDKEEVYVNYEGFRFHLYYKNVGIGYSDHGFVYAVYFNLCLPEDGVEYSGDITIPQKIPYHFDNGEYGFVYGQEFSFAGNENITSVIYPDAFCPSSFKGCTNLKKVVLPKTLSPHRYFTFNGSPKMFMGCKNLTEVSNVAFLKELGESYFEGCENLHHISLTEKDNYGEEVSISIIDKSAFKDCKSLESLDLSNVTSIGSYAFQGCTKLQQSLESLNFKNWISIGSYAFQGFTKLKEVTFEKGIDYLFEGVFSDCTSLKTISGFDKKKKNNGYGTISAYTFRNCKSLENISLPSTDDLRIETSAFEGCESLKQIGGDFSVSAASRIKEAAFKGCKSLETLPINWKGGGSFKREVFSGCHNLSFGDTLKAYSCGNSSFRECYKLEAVEILSDSNGSVEDSAFYDCQNLTSFSSANGIIRDKVFYNCQNLYNFKCWLNRTGYQAFYNCKKLPSVVYLSKTYGGVTIGEQSFYGCSDLERLTTFGSIIAKNNAFQGCLKLIDYYNIRPVIFTNYEKVIDSSTFPYSTYHDGVLHFANNSVYSDNTMQGLYNQGWGLFENKQFDYYEMENNGDVIYRQGTYYHVINGAIVGFFNTECVIPKMVNNHFVTRIEPKAFKDNQWVTSIEIPASVRYIDSLAFYNTPSLKSIYVKSRRPVRFYFNEMKDPAYMRPFTGIDFDKCTLYVPFGTKDIYAKANEWAKFKKIEETNDMGEEWSYPQYDYSGSTNPAHEIIEFDDQRTEDICVTNWDGNKSEALSKLEAAVVSDIGTVFKGTDISAFCELQYFKKITSIAENAFADCANLDSITIPQAVTAVGNLAFSGCNNLKKVFSLIKYPNEFNDNVFTQTTYSTAILVVPAGTKAKYQATAGWKNFATIIEEGEYPEPAQPGDLTGDSEVDGMDLVALVNVIMGTSVQTGGADLNGDGEVDGMDYVAMVNIIMGTAGSRSTDAAAARAMEQDTHHVTIDMEPLTIAPGESRELTITLQNADMDVTMVQANLTLPQGLTLTGEYSLGNRTTERNHQLYMSGQNGQHRLMLASPQNALLMGTEGAILRLTLTADASFHGGDIVLSNMLCASPTLQAARQQQAVLRLGSTNGITDIDATGQAAGKNVYTLSGQRMAAPHKGVNIIGGKKVIIK